MQPERGVQGSSELGLGLGCTRFWVSAGTESVAVKQMRLHGAEVVALDGPPEAGRQFLAELVRDHGWWPSVRNHPRPYANPFGVEGYKTIAFEIWHQLGGAVPDAVLVPTGGGDSLAGIARGFRELSEMGLAASIPLLVACQTTAAASLVRAHAVRARHVTPVTVGTSQAVSVLEDSTGDHALRALAGSGLGLSVSEQDITDAVRRLGRDGLCVEPASAVSVAAIGQLMQARVVPEGATLVCVATATGLRWQSTFVGIDSIPTRRALA